MATKKAASAASVLVPVADGTEDIELACITDTLVRCGIDVTVASVMPDLRLDVTLARKMHVKATTHIQLLQEREFDGLLLPGGMPGATHLAQSAELQSMLRRMHAANKLVGAICASPAVVLGPLGILPEGPAATCYPGMKDKLPHATQWVDESVVLHHNVLTSQGPGTAIDFALVAAALLHVDRSTVAGVAKSMLVPLPKILMKSLM